MQMPKRQGGFTLLELTTVITIVGTLSAVALPRYADILRSARVAKMDVARGAVNKSAQLYHMKWMLAGSCRRAPTRLKRFSSLLSRLATRTACSCSTPAWAPSSQSKVMSNKGPSSCCRVSDLRISFSEPA